MQFGHSAAAMERDVGSRSGQPHPPGLGPRSVLARGRRKRGCGSRGSNRRPLMKVLKVALLSAVAIGWAAPAFAQTADTSKPAVSAQATPSAKSDVKADSSKADASKPGTTVDSKSNTSASATTSTTKSTDTTTKKSTKHRKH